MNIKGGCRMRLYFHPYISRLGVDRAAVETSAWGRLRPVLTGGSRPKAAGRI